MHDRTISITVLAKPTKALWAMSLDPVGAQQLGECDALSCFVHTITTYIEGALTDESLDGSPRFIENMVGRPVQFDIMHAFYGAPHVKRHLLALPRVSRTSTT